LNDRQCVVVVVGKDVVEGFRRHPADAAGRVVGDQYDVCPAIVVDDRPDPPPPATSVEVSTPNPVSGQHYGLGMSERAIS